VISRENCPWCDRVRETLDAAGATYTEFKIERRAYHGHPVNMRSDAWADFLEALGLRTVPQVWRGTEYIGGSEALARYLAFNTNHT
jgi:glutaredoxin